LRRFQTKENAPAPPRPYVAIGSGLLVLVVSAIYAYFTSTIVVLSPQLAAALAPPAYLLLVITVAGIAFTLGDLAYYSKRKASALVSGGSVPLSPSAIGPYVLSQRRYQVVLALSAVPYGVLYSFLTGVFVYRPDISFSAFAGLTFPSVQPDALTGSPLYVPEVTVFLSSHEAMVLAPLTLILLAAISALVGFNSALAVFAYDNRAAGGGNSLTGQLGAAVGLFTGCPTCAGLYFFSLLGGSGAVSAAVVLSYYQPLFVVLSVPVLIATPYLISRSLSKVFRDGCVIPPAGHQRS
jgi:hypothetical protein